MNSLKTYSELISIPTFKERFRYLKLGGLVGEETFGCDRYLNQIFYKSPEWRTLRNDIITRDRGCDLGIDGRDIWGRVYIHHMNPIMVRDILDRTDILLDPEYLVICSFNTHNAIHYGDESLLMEDYTPRTMNDTIPWR